MGRPNVVAEAGASYERLLAESEHLARTLSADDWDGFIACLDRRQAVLDEMGRDAAPGFEDDTAAGAIAVIAKIMAVECAVNGLIESRRASVSIEAWGRRRALDAYADHPDELPG